MRKYFVCSDVHGFLGPLKEALEEKGFDRENKEHILVLLGDMLDRGPDAKGMVDFCLDLMNEDRLMFVKGNHETLFFDLITELDEGGFIASSGYIPPHHLNNGTCDTVEQFTGKSYYDFLMRDYDYEKDVASNEYIKKFTKLVKNAADFIETGKHIFVHGWIPNRNNKKVMHHSANILHQYQPEWRSASLEEWESARWDNGMDCWYDGVTEENKTIVCGHWHTSYGHYKYHNIGSGEFEKDSVFTPFEDKGILALDGCTAYTKKVNVVVMEEGEF